jgi:hypothetical protein
MYISETIYSIFLKTDVPGHQRTFAKIKLHIMFEEFIIFK